MKNKIRVGIIFGGKSGEHEISLLSAQSVAQAIDTDNFNITMIKIDKQGNWDVEQAKKQDVVFPVLHGPYGEDGTMQGLLKLLDVPFVGAGVLASAVGMDKEVCKRLWREAGLPLGRFVVLKKNQKNKWSFESIEKILGLPFFIKPSNAGSSIGVHKVKNEKDFTDARDDAFLYDNKVLCEQFIEGPEIEVAVLGNDNPEASLPGRLIPTHEFYSYEAKYLDDKGATFEIPAKLDKKLIQQIQTFAKEAYVCIGCEGMARVDFFLDKENRPFLNEVNTIPGFTKISMYPKMWEASGLSYKELLTKLIHLAIERHERDKRILTEFKPKD